MASIHDGHRERLRQRFIECGLDSFSDIEAIELLLFYALPRRDTNELAHALINRFGGFRGVLEAGVEDLCAVPGLSRNSASLIALVSSMNRRYLLTRRTEGRFIGSSKDAGEFLLPLYAYQTDEIVYILCLDGSSKLIKCCEVARGMVNKVDFSVRTVVDIALRCNCARIIFSHNHPSGTALPSGDDMQTTKLLRSSLNLIGVELADHIIVCDDDYVSFRDSGFFSQM